MAARVIDAKYSTLIGTAEQIRELVVALTGKGASVMDLRFSNFVVTAEPVGAELIQRALATTPARQRS